MASGSIKKDLLYDPHSLEGEVKSPAVKAWGSTKDFEGSFKGSVHYGQVEHALSQPQPSQYQWMETEVS